jgi:hypothetical protein
MTDPIVERFRRGGEQLVQQYGGLEGLLDKLEAMDRERQRKKTTSRGKRGRKTAPRRRPGSQSDK